MFIRNEKDGEYEQKHQRWKKLKIPENMEIKEDSVESFYRLEPERKTKEVKKYFIISI